jgi:glycosyltransferase involved in cell wall biosynthesis
MAAPLVSIMLPCFNAELTLPFALASTVAQTVDDWECIALDDGSTDRTADVLDSIARRDKRFRIERFAQNRGRGAARQRVLELVRGKYLAFLDSDDWMYPDRLACELRWLETDPRIAAVSPCVVITHGPDRAVGIQRPPGHLPTVAVFDEPVPPPLLFPPSMIRADLARATGFDPEFKRSQDSDFLIRALLGRHYALSPEFLYAFSQGSAASLAKTLEGYRFRMRAHLRHARAYPLRVARTVAETAAKIVAYRAAALVGAHQRLIERRWDSRVEPEVAAGFAAALAVVRRTIEELELAAPHAVGATSP